MNIYKIYKNGSKKCVETPYSVGSSYVAKYGIVESDHYYSLQSTVNDINYFKTPCLEILFNK